MSTVDDIESVRYYTPKSRQSSISTDDSYYSSLTSPVNSKIIMPIGYERNVIRPPQGFEFPRSENKPMRPPPGFEDSIRVVDYDPEMIKMVRDIVDSGKSKRGSKRGSKRISKRRSKRGSKRRSKRSF